MADARINISVSGQSQVNQALADADRAGTRVRANTAATLQNTLDTLKASSGLSLDPARSRADLATLRREQQVNAREVARLNQDAPARREQLAGRRANLQQRAGDQNERRQEEYASKRNELQKQYEARQDAAITMATSGQHKEVLTAEAQKQADAITEKYEKAGGQGTPRAAQKLLATKQAQIEQTSPEQYLEQQMAGNEKWLQEEQAKLEAEQQGKAQKGPNYDKLLERVSQEQQDYEDTLRGANEGLVEFADHIRAFGELAGRIERGEVSPGEAVPATRDLGHLEKLRLEENVLKGRLERAGQAELPQARKDLQNKQKEIDEAAGGTDRDAGQRQLAQSIGQSVQRAMLGVGGAVGGAIGQTLSAGIQVAGAAREVATLDAAKAVGAGAALLAITAASLASLTLPRGKELEASTNRLAGVGGVRPDDRTFGTNVTAKFGDESTVGGGDSSVVEMLAMNRAEFRDYARQVALSSGSVRGLEGRATGQLTYERALGLEQGQLNSVGAEGYRQTGTTETNVARMLSIFQQSGIINVRDKGMFDTARLGETIARANSLTDIQKSRFAKADPGRSASLIAAGERLGGMFTGSTGNGTLMKLDQAIKTGGGNEYSQALTYRALAKPGDSLYDVQRRQEAGLFDGGQNYARIYDAAKAMGSSKTKQGLAMNLSAYTGFDLRTTEQLMRGGRSAMMGVGSEKDFKTKYGSGAFQERAIDQTGDLSKLDTMLVNKLQIMGLDGKDMLVKGAQALGVDLRTKGQIERESREFAAQPNKRIAVGNGNYQDAMAVEQAKRMADIGKTLREGTLKVHVVNPPAPAPAGPTTPRTRK